MAYEDYIPGQNQRGPAPGQELAGAISGLGKLFGLDPEQAARVRQHNTTIQRDAEKEKRVKRYGELMSKYALGGGKGLTPEEVAEATDHRVWLTQGGIGATETEHLTGMTADPISGFSRAHTEKLRIEKEKKDAKAAADEEARLRREASKTTADTNKALAARLSEERKNNSEAKARYEKLTSVKNFAPIFYDNAGKEFASVTALRSGLTPIDYTSTEMPRAAGDTSSPPRYVAAQARALNAALDAAKVDGREPPPDHPKYQQYLLANAALLQHQAQYPAFKLTPEFRSSLADQGYTTDLTGLRAHFKDDKSINQAIKAVALTLRKENSISATEANDLATMIVARHLRQGANENEMAVDGDEEEVAANLAAGKYTINGKIPRYITIQERYRMENGDIGIRYRMVDTSTISKPIK